MSDDAVRSVLHRSIPVQVPDNLVSGILDVSIRLDVADDPVGGVLDGPVGLDVGDDPVSGILDRLGGSRQAGHDQEKKKGKESAHDSFPAKNTPEMLPYSLNTTEE